MSGGTILHYGGTFDPPHNGHMALVRAAARLLRDAAGEQLCAAGQAAEYLERLGAFEA